MSVTIDDIPAHLYLHMPKVGQPEALRWVEFYETCGDWPTIEQAYKIRYERGDLRNIPFSYFRKFVLQDLSLSDFEKENLFLRCTLES